MNTNQIELFVHSPSTDGSDAWLQIALKLLDWPFLIFVILVLFILFLQKQLRGLLNRDNILIKWGDKTILLGELGKNIGQDIDSKFDSLQEKKKTLKEFISDLPVEEAQAKTINVGDLPNIGQKKIDIHKKETDALNRMKEALMSPAFRWRTLSRLAHIAAISESEARSMLPELGVDFDVNSSGQPIVKLKSR